MIHSGKAVYTNNTLFGGLFIISNQFAYMVALEILCSKQ